MSDYRLTTTATVLRLADGASIPADPANSDYAEYLAWVEAGGVPMAADAEPDITADTVRAQMLALEDRQARAVRECLLALAGQGVALPADAASRLASIERQIAELRSQL